MKQKSARNKTIDFSLEEGKPYLEKCLSLHSLESFKSTTVNSDEFLSQIENKIITGDSFEICKHLPNAFVDLLITDPPYNLTKNYHGNVFSKTDKTNYETFTRRWLDSVVPLLKKNASIYVCCDWTSGLIIGNVLSEYFTVQNRITWQREKGRGAKRNWKNGAEDIWFCTNSDDFTFNLNAVKIRRKVIAPYKENGTAKDWVEGNTKDENYRDTCPSNFWDDITIPFWSMPENTAHPTQKPEKLIAKLLLASSDENDIVFDPFLGSGSTAVVAKKLNRKYVGIEQNPLYCAWGQYRLERAETDTTIQGFKDGIFTERNWGN